MIGYFEKLLYKKEKTFSERIFLFPLYLISILFGIIIRVRVILYYLGIFKKRYLPCPVISVGNLTLGGTGKTPLVIYLAKGLKERGLSVAILTRGYKGKMKEGLLIKDTQNISPKILGDEPSLLIKTLDEIPVIIGSNRFRNAQVALKKFPIAGFLLDDGFQHLKLHRDIDILLIDSQIGFGDKNIFPRGILREPVSHLRRADIYLITKIINKDTSRLIEDEILRLKPFSIIFHSNYEPLFLINRKEEINDIESFYGKNVMALSSIGNPYYFSHLLKECGMIVANEITFPDHHYYTDRDLTFIKEKVKQVDCIVTTEKDMVKLNCLDIEQLPIYALRVEMRIWEEEDFYNKIWEIFKSKKSREGFKQWQSL